MSPLAGEGGHRFRWVLDVEEEMAQARSMQRHLALIPEPEQRLVLSFVQPIDQHRALASRLMQRACVCLGLALEWPAVSLALTKGRKPFTTNAKPASAPNFNYNVSHEGRFVVLASEPHQLVGVDVAAPRAARPGAAARPLGQYLHTLRGALADCEWALLQGLAHDEAKQEAAFQRLWSLKEAYIKARGDGLGFAPLSRAAFRFAAAGPGTTSRAELVLDGAPQAGWHFLCEPLPYGHCVSVALGPTSDAVDQLGAFRATLHRRDAPPPGSDTAADGPSFKAVTLAELLAAVGVA